MKGGTTMNDMANMVGMGCFAGTDTLRRVFGQGNRMGESDYEAVRNRVPLPDVGFLVVAPYGRGEIAGYNGVGENDVLRVLRDVRTAYNVDPDRIYLTGLSMGGGGTWHIGLRYPDLFAAIVPVCAVADVSLFPGRSTESDRQLFDVGQRRIEEFLPPYHRSVDTFYRRQLL